MKGAQKQRYPMKRYATPKYKGLKNKDIFEKRGNPKTQETKKQRHPMKK
jgi:hypothetical protein